MPLLLLLALASVVPVVDDDPLSRDAPSLRTGGSDASEIDAARFPELVRRPTGSQRAGNALPAVLVGTGIGSVVGSLFVLSTFGGTGPFGPLLGLTAMVTAPAVAVAFFTDDLAPWTWGLTSAAAFVGMLVGGAVGGFVGLQVFLATTEPSDCTLCGYDTIVAVTVPALVGGTALAMGGAVLASSFGAFAQADAEHVYE